MRASRFERWTSTCRLPTRRMARSSHEAERRHSRKGRTMEKETETETLSLADATTHLLEECRMVLPGVQALFGFQLIAVFNSGFTEKLSHAEQSAHLLALALVAIAGALIMSPASYHRQTSPRAASTHFIRLGGRLLVTALVPLLLGIGLDF